jgi:hypothetical protein
MAVATPCPAVPESQTLAVGRVFGRPEGAAARAMKTSEASTTPPKK